MSKLSTHFFVKVIKKPRRLDADVDVVVVVVDAVVVVLQESAQDAQSQKLLQRFRKSGKETEREKKLSWSQIK